MLYALVIGFHVIATSPSLDVCQQTLPTIATVSDGRVCLDVAQLACVMSGKS